MRRTKEEAEETKQAILVAARTLFIKEGFSGTTLDDVAHLAGFTRGAVHWHFHNKLGILLAIREIEHSPVQQLIEDLSTDNSLDPLDSMLAVTTQFILDMNRDPDKKKLFQVIVQAMHNEKLDPDFVRKKQLDVQLRSLVQDILILAEKRAPLAGPWQPKTAALAFHCAINGVINDWLYDAASFDLIDDALVMITTFINSLRGKEASAGSGAKVI